MLATIDLSIDSCGPDLIGSHVTAGNIYSPRIVVESNADRP